jgi:hypothetical protein
VIECAHNNTRRCSQKRWIDWSNWGCCYTLITLLVSARELFSRGYIGVSHPGLASSLFSRVAIRLMYAYGKLHGDFGATDWLLMDATDERFVTTILLISS